MPKTTETDSKPEGLADGETVNPETGEIVSAWELDERYGVRLDQTFSIGDRFMLLGAKPEGTIQTTIGDADVVALLVQRLDDKGVPTGIPFRCSTLARAIVEKMANATPGDFPAIVELGKVVSKRFQREALVITKVGDTDPGRLYEEFGVTPDTLQRAEQARPERERIGF